MEKITRQSVGIDCSKDDFAVRFSISYVDLEVKHLASRVFKNQQAGFSNFLDWVEKYNDPSLPNIFVMEATGVYHERLACFLYDQQQQVAVVLPQRAKNFSKTLKVKTITDKESAKYLAVMGLEKKLDLWIKPEEIYITLKNLTRERSQIQKQVNEVKNQIHAEKSGAWPNQKSLLRLNERLQFLQKQKAEIEEDIAETLKAKPELNARIKKVTTIPGIGVLTAVTVIAETHAFRLIQNKRQLVSYAGYDVIEKESGTSVHSKPRISKRGNRHIRKAMHMPACASIRCSDSNKELFKRIVSRSGIKMKGVVAVQRKLLVLIYILWKNDAVYDPEYEYKKEIGQHKAALTELDQVRP